jgi:hypothetical protein
MGSVRCEVKERYFMAEYQYIFARYDFLPSTPQLYFLYFNIRTSYNYDIIN